MTNQRTTITSRLVAGGAVLALVGVVALGGAVGGSRAAPSSPQAVPTDGLELLWGTGGQPRLVRAASVTASLAAMSGDLHELVWGTGERPRLRPLRAAG